MNIRFDCPVLDENAKKAIAAISPENGDAIVRTLSQCPSEMTVLSLMCIAIQESIERKEALHDKHSGRGE